jgi:hypothetical protein
MLQAAINRERRKNEQAILQHYEELYHPHAVLVPSARFGLYAVAKELLSLGDRVLISPITCRTVVEALLAAGVVPVFVDIEPDTGNIDPGRLSDSVLTAARAIVTTNLYGNPDNAPHLRRAAAKHDLLFIEDCAHVIHTVIDGRRVGSLGDVSVFSFKKYFDEPGGVITFRGETAARAVRARVSAEAPQMAPTAGTGGHRTIHGRVALEGGPQPPRNSRRRANSVALGAPAITADIPPGRRFGESGAESFEGGPIYRREDENGARSGRTVPSAAQAKPLGRRCVLSRCAVLFGKARLDHCGTKAPRRADLFLVHSSGQRDLPGATRSGTDIHIRCCRFLVPPYSTGQS